MDKKNLIIKKTYWIFLIIFSLNLGVNAQEEPYDFWKNVRFGGGFGLNFGDGFFSATLAPSAIYDFNDYFSLGLGLNGTINNQKNIYKSTILGGSIIGLCNAISNLQLSAEFEQLNVSRKYNATSNIKNENYWYPALFIGAGYRFNNMAFGIRYDVLYKQETSIYQNAWAPFVRVYF